MSKTAQSKDHQLDEQIRDLAKRARLDGWNAFVEELKVPSDLFPALITMRPELVRLAPKRPLTADEAEALYKLIAGLIETNIALREHASNVKIMVENWYGAIRGLVKTAGRIGRFAEFRHDDAAAEDDEEE